MKRIWRTLTSAELKKYEQISQDKFGTFLHIFLLVRIVLFHVLFFGPEFEELCAARTFCPGICSCSTHATQKKRDS